MTRGLKRLKGAYICYVTVFFFSYFAMSAFSSVLSVYLTGIGRSASEMSLIVSASGLFSFLTVPVTGYLCDRTGRPKRISGILLLLLAGCALIFGGCRRVWALFVLNGLIMSFTNSVMPVSERLAGACRFRYGTLRVWGTFGYAAGAQAAGLLIGNLPGMALFAVVAVAALLAALGYWGVEDPLPEKPPEEDQTESRARLSSLITQPQFLLYLLVAFLFSGASGVNMNFAPLLLRELGISTGAVGTVLFFSTLVEIPLVVFSNRFMDRFSGKTLLLAAFGIGLVQYVCYAFAPAAGAVIAAMVLLKAISSTLFMMLILKIVRNLIDPRLTTTGISVVNTVNSLGTIVMQNLSGPIADARGIRTVYLVLCVLLLLAAVLTLFLKVGNREKVFG